MHTTAGELRWAPAPDLAAWSPDWSRISSQEAQLNFILPETRVPGLHCYTLGLYFILRSC